MTTQQFGRYCLEELLAVGGMGEVYLAVDRGSPGALPAYEKLCVVKRILPSLSSQPEIVAMFAREAAFAAQLCHSNITQIYDHGIIDGQPFIVMEYVHGQSLKAFLDAHRSRGGPVPIREAIYVATEVAQALDHAHRRTGRDGIPLNIVHRDVSPQNVLLSVEGEVKLTDFGMVKGNPARGVYQTQETSLKGKLAYLSPEQASGGDVGQPSDLFSFGILVHELVAGAHPFAHDGAQGITLLDRIKRAECARLDVLRPDVPGALADVVEQCLMREPSDRPAGARALLLALEDVRLAHAASASPIAFSSYLESRSLLPAPRPPSAAVRTTTREASVPVVTTPASLPVPPAGGTRESPRPVSGPEETPWPPAGHDDEEDAGDDALAAGLNRSRARLIVVGGLGVLAFTGATAWLAGRPEQTDVVVAAPEPPAPPPSPRAAIPDDDDDEPRDRRLSAARAKAVGRERARAMAAAFVDDVDAGARGPVDEKRPDPDAGAVMSTSAPPAPTPLLPPKERCVAAPPSPGFPPRGGMRFDTVRPIRVELDGRHVLESLQGSVELDAASHTLRLGLIGDHFLTLILGKAEQGRRDVRITSTVPLHVSADGSTRGTPPLDGIPIRQQGTVLTFRGAHDALSVTLR